MKFRYLLVYILILTLFMFFKPLQLSKAQSDCPDAPQSRLGVGELARVTPGDPNRVRSEPSTDSELRGSIPGEYLFIVLDGPICAEGYQWWQIQTVNEGGNYIYGWTVEGSGNTYWLEPVSVDELQCNWDSYWDDTPLAYSSLGNDIARRGFYTTAIALYNCSLQLDPELIGVYRSRGLAYLELGNHEAALADFEHINAEIEPIEVYYRMGEYRQALDMVNALLASSRNLNTRYKVFMLRGKIHLDLGYYVNAQTDFENALEIYDTQEALMGLGDAHRGQDKSALATHYYFRAMLEISKIYYSDYEDYAPIYLRLGLAYEDLMLYSNALGSYQSYLLGVSEDEADTQVIERVAELEAQGITAFNPYVPDIETSEIPEITYFGQDAIRSVAIRSDVQSLGCPLVWSPDGTLLTIGNTAYRIDSYDAELLTFEFGEGLVQDVAFSPDGQTLAFSYSDGIYFFEPETTTQINYWEEGERFVFHPEVPILVASQRGNYHALFDPSTGEKLQTLESFGTPLAISSDGNMLAASGGWRNPALILWDIETGNILQEIETPSAFFNTRFSPDDSLLITKTYDSFAIYDMQTYAQLALYTEFNLGNANIQFAPSGGQFILGGAIFDTQTGIMISEIFVSESRLSPSHCAVISPEGTHIAAWFTESIYIWELDIFLESK